MAKLVFYLFVLTVFVFDSVSANFPRDGCCTRWSERRNCCVNRSGRCCDDSRPDGDSDFPDHRKPSEGPHDFQPNSGRDRGDNDRFDRDHQRPDFDGGRPGSGESGGKHHQGGGQSGGNNGHGGEEWGGNNGQGSGESGGKHHQGGAQFGGNNGQGGGESGGKHHQGGGELGGNNAQGGGQFGGNNGQGGGGSAGDNGQGGGESGGKHHQGGGQFGGNNGQGGRQTRAIVPKAT